MATSGSLTNFIDDKDVCSQGIGDAVMQMLILCKMRRMTIHDTLKFTKKIKDERIADPNIALIMIMKYLGELSGDVYNKSDMKANIGYLLIHLTAFSHSLKLSIKKCTVRAFEHIKDDEYIMFDGNRIDQSDEGYERARKIIAAARTVALRKLDQ